MLILCSPLRFDITETGESSSDNLEASHNTDQKGLAQPLGDTKVEVCVSDKMN